MMHGAVVIQIEGNFDDGMRLVEEIGRNGELEIVNSVNPYRLHGQKTVSFEIIEQLGYVPDFHALPVGNAGNITAHWMGYSEASGKNCCFQESVGNYEIEKKPFSDEPLFFNLSATSSFYSHFWFSCHAATTHFFNRHAATTNFFNFFTHVL